MSASLASVSMVQATQAAQPQVAGGGTLGSNVGEEIGGGQGQGQGQGQGDGGVGIHAITFKEGGEEKVGLLPGVI